ncbi:flagellar hook-associated protein 3 [mine drainage metagenome]|uniref:Flagellar hook-associated protein 3 n=1 Tax=mine drainage metagenome TaxID=410659 RepID=A0A1J5R0A0_9ZZZZ
MRVSTSQMYNLGVNSMEQQYSAMVKTQQQLSTGRSMLTPSDNPVAAAQALDVAQSQSTNAQYITNTAAATSALSMQESILSSATTTLQSIQTIAVQAGDPSLNSADRQSLAIQLQGTYDQLLGLANSTDGNGQYLFSGYKGNTQPFTPSASGAQYNGDQGQRMVQISASQQVAISSSGAGVFQLIKNGNGTFATGAANANTGTGVVSPGVVVDTALWNASTNSRDFSLKFDVTAGVTTYDVVDNVSGNSLLTGAPAAAAGPYTGTFTSGGNITLPTTGAQLTITGQPATGDTFTVQASKSNQDIFSTISSLIATLKGPVGTGTNGDTTLANNLNTAISNLGNGLNNLLTVRASVGATLQQVNAQNSTNTNLATGYASTLSGLQDLDYAKAISNLSLQQLGLSAAQKSFVTVQGLSLFNYIQ